MATEDFNSDFSSLLYPTFSPPRLTPSLPPHFLPSSSSMVIYQGSNQSMDDTPQNQGHEDIVDPALYLAGDSALLQQQQQLRQNWSEASDWRPRGGIMTMNVLELQNNNQGFEESNMGFEEESNEDIRLAFSYQHILEDKSGALHVINWEEFKNGILDLLFDDFASFMDTKFVGLSTLKRACRGHRIPSWPPCGEHNQFRPNESPAVVDKEPIPQLNSDTLLPSNQVSATIGTKSVTVKARFSTVTMKFQLSWPWRMVELKQQVEKRLGHEAENYYICYKDQDNDDDLLIACDR